jgi:hypothetical protein
MFWSGVANYAPSKVSKMFASDPQYTVLLNLLGNIWVIQRPLFTRRLGVLYVLALLRPPAQS